MNALTVRKFAAIFIIALLLAACGGKKEVKRVSQESKISQEAFDLAEKLRTAYLKKDFSAIADICTKDGYREVIDSIKHFDSAELEFMPRLVEIDRPKVVLNISWKGRWTAGETTVKERGLAVFQLEGTPLKLNRIVRGNPFKYPER